MFKLVSVTAVNIIRSYAKRPPLVKFRYGKMSKPPPDTCPAPSKKKVLKNPGAVDVLGSSRAGVMYDFQIPSYLQRAVLSDAEIECINSGGATKIFQ